MMWQAGHPAGAVRNPTNPLRTALQWTSEGCGTIPATTRPCCLPHTPGRLDCCGPTAAAPRQQHPTGGRGRSVTAAAAPCHHGLTPTPNSNSTSSFMSSYCPQHTVFTAGPSAPRTGLMAAACATAAATATATATAPPSTGPMWGVTAPHRRTSVQCSAVRSRRRRTDVPEQGTEAVSEEPAASTAASSNSNYGNGAGELYAGGDGSSHGGAAEGQQVPAARGLRRRVRTQSPTAAAVDADTQEAMKSSGSSGSGSSSSSPAARASGGQGASASPAPLDRDPASLKVGRMQQGVCVVPLTKPRSCLPPLEHQHS